MRSLILSQYRDLRIALTTVYVQDSSESAGGGLFEIQEDLVERVTVVKFRVDNRGSDGTGCFRIEVGTDTAELSDMRVAGLRK